eukprot:7571_1
MDQEHKLTSLVDELINIINNGTKQDRLDSTNLYLQIATVNWITICAFAHTDTLVSLSMICKELYQIINQNEYLAHQTLLSVVQNNINNINLMYKNCRFNDVDDVDLSNNQTRPVTLPLFTPNIFKRMSLFPNTKLFHCYSRLISYNWRLHYTIQQNSFLQLAKVHNKLTQSQFKHRNLNDFETKLFAIPKKPFHKGLKSEKITCDIKYNDRLFDVLTQIENKSGISWHKQCLVVQGKKLNYGYKFDIEAESAQWNYKNVFEKGQAKDNFTINNFDNFITNLNTFGYYQKWKGIIFEFGFFLAGGMVLKCLLKNYLDENESNKSMKKD